MTTSLAARTVLRSDEARSADPLSLGGKAANLARLGETGVPIPSWFVIPTDVYVRTLSGLREEIHGHLEQLDWTNPAHVRQTSLVIAERIKALSFGKDDREALLEAYRSFGTEALVAVRSSAVDEDSATASFAGQMDTFLFVKGDEDVLSAIKGCWASAFSERALCYRHQNRLAVDDIRAAVIIQEMVFGEVSGVLFTANPISGKWHEAVVSGTYGLGEGLVSGELDADNWIVDKETKRIRAEVASKPERIVLDETRGRGTTKEPVPADRQALPSLSETQILELVALGDRIAEHFGNPQDIEWTLRDGQVYLLQARPITTLKPRPAGKKRLWDNSNIAESYYGVTTPLTFSFVNRMYEVAYQVMFDAFGIPQEVLRKHHAVFANLLGILNGRIFYNLDNYYQIITFLPAYEYMKDFFDTMIGVQEKKDYDKARFSLAERLFVGGPKIAYLIAKIGGNFLDWDREVERFTSRFNRIFGEFRGRDYAAMDPDSLLDIYRRLEDDLLWHWRAPMTNDFFAMVFYGLLRKLTTRWLDPTGALQNDLLCGEGGLESTEPAKALIRLAISVRSDLALSALFKDTPESEITAALQDPRFAKFREQLDHYLHAYGYRCMGELKLEVKNLQEDPTFVYTMIKNYQALEKLDMAEMEAQERLIRDKAEREVASKLGPVRKPLFGWVLKNARKGVRNRENLRMARTRAFGLVREIFQGMGVQLHGLGLLDHPDDVFYLDFNDLFSFVEGRSTCTNLRALAALRKEEFAGYEALPVDDRLVTVGAVYYGDQLYDPARSEADDEGPVLQGTSCCPGQVVGIARVILKPEDDMRLNGEILVTERTDPGWVPLYPSASGLLIERGSLLSHAAVVARELGLPTIIGLKNLTKRVKDGQHVEMDGRAGTVRIDSINSSPLKGEGEDGGALQ